MCFPIPWSATSISTKILSKVVEKQYLTEKKKYKNDTGQEYGTKYTTVILTAKVERNHECKEETKYQLTS